MASRFAASLSGAGMLLPFLALIAAAPVAAQTASPASAEGVTRMDAVTVSATRTETIAITRPEAVSVITREDIERRMPSTVGELFEGIPGVEAGGGPRPLAQQPVIRGLSGDRVVVRLDGARQNFNAGHKGRVFVDPGLLKQVDVLRGPGSTLFGTGAMGGVVTMTTVDADDLLAPGQVMGGRITAGLASNNTGRHSTLTAFARPNQTLDFLASASVRASDDIRHGDGTSLRWSGDSTLSGLLKIGVQPADFHRVTLQAQRYKGDARVPTNVEALVNTTSNREADRETVQDTVVLAWRYRNPTDRLFDTRATLYRNHVDVDETRVGLPARHDVRRQTTTGLDVANSSRFSFGEQAEARLTIGGEYFSDSQAGRRDGAPVPSLYADARLNTYGAFAQAEITLFETWTLTPGVRLDGFDLSADGQPSRSGSAVSPKISLAWQATPWLQPYVSYGEAFNAPSLGQMYNTGNHFMVTRGPVVVASDDFISNPNLRPEKARNAEIGVNFQFRGVATERDALRIKVAAFENTISDYLTTQATSFARNRTRTQWVNASTARIRGGELEAAYDARTVFGSLAASTLRGKNLTTDQDLEGIPADTVSATLGGRVLDWGLEFGWRTTVADTQKRVPGGAAPTPGYAVHGLFATWTPEMMNDAVTVNFAVSNLFDRHYTVHGTTPPAPGRDVRLGATLRF